MSREAHGRIINAALGIRGLKAQMLAMESEIEGEAEGYIQGLRELLDGDRLEEMLEHLDYFKSVYGTGFAKRLEASGIPSPREARRILLSRCNDGDGRWVGEFPVAELAVRPPKGTWVVYQLLLGSELVYLGSTGDFLTRLKAHSRDKEFDGWRASQCDSERACRDLETALIDRYRPPLNRMIPTPKVALR